MKPEGRAAIRLAVWKEEISPPISLTSFCVITSSPSAGATHATAKYWHRHGETPETVAGWNSRFRNADPRIADLHFNLCTLRVLLSARCWNVDIATLGEELNGITHQISGRIFYAQAQRV